MQKTQTRALAALLVLLAIPVGSLAGQENQEKAPAADGDKPLTTLNEKASYALGLQIGERFKDDGAEIDPAFVARGIADAMKGAKPLLTQQEIEATMEAFTQEMQAKFESRQKALAAKNKKDGAAFLAENKTKPGVKTLPSGLQYQVVKAGTGATPTAEDVVKAHYHGTLIDGTIFDSSVDRKEPIVIPVNGVIKGWQEALQMMKVGSKWKLFVPAELAYGDNPRPGGPIGPGAVLIFDVELLGIEKQ